MYFLWAEMDSIQQRASETLLQITYKLIQRSLCHLWTQQVSFSSIAFLFQENAKLINYYSTVNFDEYVQRIRATTEWGGQLEIQALANALRIPIWIYSADAPIIKMGENYKETPLLLAYAA